MQKHILKTDIFFLVEKDIWAIDNKVHIQAKINSPYKQYCCCSDNNFAFLTDWQDAVTSHYSSFT